MDLGACTWVLPLPLGAGSWLKGLGADGTGFVNLQMARACTQGRFRISVNTCSCTGCGALQGADA